MTSSSARKSSSSSKAKSACCKKITKKSSIVKDRQFVHIVYDILKNSIFLNYCEMRRLMNEKKDFCKNTCDFDRFYYNNILSNR